MTDRGKREVLYEILAEDGYSDWIITEPHPLRTDESYTLCNFSKRRKAEVAVPDEWFEDPRRYHSIGELLTLAIDNSSPVVSPADMQQLLQLFSRPRSASPS